MGVRNAYTTSGRDLGELGGKGRETYEGRSTKMTTVETISRDELTEKIAKHDKFRLVEILPEEEYHQAHLPGAINLPPDQVSRLASKRLRDRNAEIILYSDGSASHRSEEAARELAEKGYTNVRDYAEGKQDWIDTGLPVVSDKVESDKKD
jgi:rhodanese-related sulfurtransferase